eukprot:GHVS01022996.1.p1 GENE.GHVS01022996.1~~GHVS01022996.1.p1  ORF type:complete len:351 (-),score=36.35 GHVS01022996.1:651-1703(-)
MECLPPLPVPSSSYPPLLSPCGFSSGSSAGQQLEADICQSFLLESIRDWTVNRFGTNSLPGIRKHSRFHLLHRGCGLLSFFLIFLVFVLWSASVQANSINVELVENITGPTLEILFDKGAPDFGTLSKTRLMQQQFATKHSTEEFGSFSCQHFKHRTKAVNRLVIKRNEKKHLLGCVGVALRSISILDEIRKTKSLVVNIIPPPATYKDANDFLRGLSTVKDIQWRVFSPLPDDFFHQVMVDSKSNYMVEVEARGAIEELSFWSTNLVVHALRRRLDVNGASSFFLFDEMKCKHIMMRPGDKLKGVFTVKQFGMEGHAGVAYSNGHLGPLKKNYINGDPMVVGEFGRLKL